MLLPSLNCNTAATPGLINRLFVKKLTVTY